MNISKNDAKDKRYRNTKNQGKHIGPALKK